MDLKRRLHRALKITTKEFTRALDSFDPTVGDKTYPERMVSYYYIRAIAKALHRANVLLELPVIGKHEHKQDNHIDALIFNDREVVVAEFKRGWAPSHWESLARDFERLRGPNVAKEIRRGFAGRQPPPAFIFLGADCWRQEKAKAWKSGMRSGKQWNLPKPMLAAHRDYLTVYSDKEGKDYDGYYFTWAVIPFDEMAA
jgi:hypothetical protein